MPCVPILTYFGIKSENKGPGFLFCFALIQAFSGVETQINKLVIYQLSNTKLSDLMSCLWEGKISLKWHNLSGA